MGFWHVLPLALEHGTLTFADIYDGFVHANSSNTVNSRVFCHGVTKRWKFQHVGPFRAKKHRKQHC